MFNIQASWSGPLIGPTPCQPSDRNLAAPVPRRSSPFRSVPFLHYSVAIHKRSSIAVSSLVHSHNPNHRSSESHPASLRADAEQLHHSSTAQCRIHFSRTAVLLSRCSLTSHCCTHRRTAVDRCSLSAHSRRIHSVCSPLIAGWVDTPSPSTHPTRRVGLHCTSAHSHPHTPTLVALSFHSASNVECSFECRCRRSGLCFGSRFP